MDKDERISDIGGSVVTDSGDSSGGIAEPRLRTMGVCLFEKQVLLAELDRDESGAGGARGLMGDLVPSLLSSRRVLGYRFGLDRGRVTPDRYWCDLASIDAYYDANLALLRADPPLDLYQKDWSIRTYQGQYPPARTIPGNSGTEGIFVNSMLAAGTLIVGGGVNHSILCPRVRVEDRAIVDSSILCDGVTVGEGSHLRNCIVDKDVQIPPDMRIGFEPAEDRQRFTVSDKGVVVIPKGYSFSG
jgi:glucose-1-phosphate adenylyltransferase